MVAGRCVVSVVCCVWFGVWCLVCVVRCVLIAVCCLVFGVCVFVV